jgi:hypothetical protein
MDENSFDGTGKVKIKLPKDVRTQKHQVMPRMSSSGSSANLSERTQSLPVNPKKAKSVNLQEYLDKSLSSMKLQLNNYQDVCSKISVGRWELVDVVDYLHILVKSLNFDAVSLLIIDPEHPGKFLPMVSRGYLSPPPIEVESYWTSCFSADKMSLEWNKLLSLAQRAESPLVEWMDAEDIFRIGYSPVQDGEKITGFMIISSYKDKNLSPLASALLELCGGHIGLALAARKTREVHAEYRHDTKEALINLKHMLNSLAVSEDLTVDQLVDTIEKSQELIEKALSDMDC